MKSINLESPACRKCLDSLSCPRLGWVVLPEPPLKLQTSFYVSYRELDEDTEE